MKTSDPRMAAIRDFAVAYATYELASGVDTVPTDPTDDALRAALEAAANPGVVVDDRVLDWAEAAGDNTDDGDRTPTEVDPDAAGGAVVAPTEIAGTQPATAPIAD